MKTRVNNMQQFNQARTRMRSLIRAGILFAAVLGLSLAESALAQGVDVSEQTFGCILVWPKVRNTRFKHADQAKLKEAMRILRDSVPDKEYPIGTILQLIPSEAMVKHPREKFPNTNGWEFFALDVSEAGTK